MSVPRALDEFLGPLAGTVGLPAILFWSGRTHGAVRWDLADLGRRRDLYEIVLVEGALDDIRCLVNGDVWSNSGIRCIYHRGHGRPGAI